MENTKKFTDETFSSPFIEERLYLEIEIKEATKIIKFSSPFIEERLYLKEDENGYQNYRSSRPLLSRSGCISIRDYDYNNTGVFVLVPFYRGAVVFTETLKINIETKESSRPLLSRSGCIY